MSLKERIDELVSLHGSFRAVGKALAVDHTYLCRLRNGESTAPSEEVLQKLRLEKVVIYRPLRSYP